MVCQVTGRQPRPVRPGRAIPLTLLRHSLSAAQRWWMPYEGSEETTALAAALAPFAARLPDECLAASRYDASRSLQSLAHSLACLSRRSPLAPSRSSSLTSLPISLTRVASSAAAAAAAVAPLLLACYPLSSPHTHTRALLSHRASSPSCYSCQSSLQSFERLLLPRRRPPRVSRAVCADDEADARTTAASE